MLGVDLRLVAHPPQVHLQPEHLAGDGVAGGRAGVELVDDPQVHFVATIA